MMINNHSNILTYLDYVHQSAIKKYEAKAYLWHYQYADIQSSLNKIEDVIDQYNYFTHY
jgi:hypothetical protein